MDTLELVQYRKASNLYKILYNRFSVCIIDLLTEHKELHVSDIFQKLELSQSQVSQQLSKLRKTKLVSTKKVKNIVYYKINKERIDYLKNVANTIV